MRRDFSVIHSPESAAPDAKKIILPFHDLTQTAQEIVREIHTRLVEEGIFVPREDEEAMWNNHHVIIDSSNPDLPLAGASAMHDSDDFTEITRIWTQENLRNNGVASAIVRYWIQCIQSKVIGAFTTQEAAKNMLKKNGFEMVGPVNEIQHYGKSLPMRAQKYPRGRNPWFLARFSEK